MTPLHQSSLQDFQFQAGDQGVILSGQKTDCDPAHVGPEIELSLSTRVF